MANVYVRGDRKVIQDVVVELEAERDKLDTAFAGVAEKEALITTADVEEAAGANPTAEEYALVVALVNELKAKLNAMNA